MNLAEEFPLEAGLCYLNHAAIGVWPQRTAAAVGAFAEENMRRGAAGWPDWARREQRLRERMAVLVNAPSADDIALLKNTSEALSVVAWGLPWRHGDNVVFARQEFPSNRFAWESLARIGVEPRAVDLTDTEDPEAALMRAADERTRLLSVSSVQYGDGLRMDLQRLGEFCRERDIRFCVDAIQSLGALPFDCRACYADFVMADGHKWLLGPEGVALFYCRAELREELALYQYGWRMVDEPFNFDREDWAPSPIAHRFEPGSPNTLGIYAQEASLSLLQEVGIERVAEAVLENAAHLAQGLAAIAGVTVISDRRPGRTSGIVVFNPENADVSETYRALMTNGVVCARRGAGIRLSPHFYTPRERLDQALEVIRQALER